MAENEDKPRLIERGFCLKQASISSVHEKSVRYGHISTLHIWPARRPLAACRAALIATLLPDPGDPDRRKELLERIGGKVVRVQKRTKKDGKEEVRFVEGTEGGILHWGRESGPDLDYFREEIRKAYGGRAPKVLDPFAGGGAIPLEAMRLGCEATAIDINPVAWFIEKCTLEYPQRLAGKKMPLPDFILENKEFIDKFCEAQGIKPSAKMKKQSSLASFDGEKMVSGKSLEAPLADLAWHVRAWGSWVLQKAKNDLEMYYHSSDGKPTVAYLWARTVKCKNCRASIPLMKTRWLCKKNGRQILLKINPDSVANRISYSIIECTPYEAAHLPKSETIGTKGGKGAWCPFCGKPGTVSMTMEDIQLALRDQYATGHFDSEMYAVVIESGDIREFRTPSQLEVESGIGLDINLLARFQDIPFGIPGEEIVEDSKGNTWCVQYGANTWGKQFTRRQLNALAAFVKYTREARILMDSSDVPKEWADAIMSYLCIAVDRTVDRSSAVCHWDVTRQNVSGTFSGYRMPIAWDYCEANPIGNKTGSYWNQLNIICHYIDHSLKSFSPNSKVRVDNQSAKQQYADKYDVIVTDPPYYDAISYSLLMDFFYVWLRRTMWGFSDEFEGSFKEALAPKWNKDKNDGELIDDSSRFSGNRESSRIAYEDGMADVFSNCRESLTSNGRFVMVFAHKQPEAWETLVSAIVRSGFTVEASWPIQTEMGNRTRALSSAALSSSVWLVCRKRSNESKPGWDNKVLEEMRSNIQLRLREYWDAGIRGPDFIWAATGPALESYSKHAIVKKANDPGQIMTVTEFLIEVRRIVMDFVVGRVLREEGERDRDLDNITTYYLLHRHDFGFGDAPAGSCILYAVSCDLSDSALAGENDILLRSGGMEEPAEDEGEETEEDFIEEGTSSTFRLKAWNKRKSKNLGMDSNGRPAPMIDRVHKLMQLWKDGDMAKVDDYLVNNGLLKNKTFHHILQAIIELSKEGDEERSLLESISNHIISRGGAVNAPKGFSDFGG